MTRSVSQAVATFNGGWEYETVAASQTGQVIGATGGKGDYISHILIVPETTAPGVVTLLDNATSITVYTGSASYDAGLAPITVALGLKSVSGAWKVTTGANVHCVVAGDFTA